MHSAHNIKNLHTPLHSVAAAHQLQDPQLSPSLFAFTSSLKQANSGVGPSVCRLELGRVPLDRTGHRLTSHLRHVRLRERCCPC
ncbi:unnamed protein product [Knipowitschia caucasica]|uniref:Uncharacterized protein n=1 Tax=Knipowitschia caucasica TaxID=637954 RepID=A0AAV2KFA3_KNICA